MLLCIIRFVVGNLNTGRVDKLCNEQAYGDNDPFQANLNNILNHLPDGTAHNKYNYYLEYPWDGPDPICYGHGVCNRQFSLNDCIQCMNSAAQQIIDECPKSIGAQIQLVDCRVRYEQYNFNE